MKVREKCYLNSVKICKFIFLLLLLFITTAFCKLFGVNPEKDHWGRSQLSYCYYYYCYYY